MSFFFHIKKLEDPYAGPMSHYMADHVRPKILLSLGQLCQTSVHIDMDMTVERHCTSYPG